MRLAFPGSAMLTILLVSSSSAFAATHSLTVSPSSVGFGSQTVSTTASQALAITNSGTGSVQVQAVGVSGSSAFQVGGFAGVVTLRPGQSLGLSISFSPSAATSYSGTLSITASGGASRSVALSGSGAGTAPVVSIAISPPSATVQVNATQQFTAAVSGTTNLGVTWMVGGVAGGNSTVGTISTSGLYTAPASVLSSGSATVTVVSAADPTKSASAAVTITTARTVYSNIDDVTTLDTGSFGWGWCGTISCAGGGSTATQSMSWGQQPSLDGGSTQFMVSGSAFADALWWNKLGANNAVANFQFDFWLNVSTAATSYSQALEFDMFQYISPVRYMFGTECNYSNGYNTGTWDVWNAGVGSWQHTTFACPGFVAGDWYHITWSFDRTSDQDEHYNSVTVAHYDSSGTTQLSSSTTTVNIALPSGPLPSGWNNNLGVQFQLDVNSVPGSTGTASYTTHVDKVTLTAW